MMARGARSWRPGAGFPGLRVSGLRFGKAADDVAAEETPPDGESARLAVENGAPENGTPENGTARGGTPEAGAAQAGTPSGTQQELQAGSVPRWLQTSAAWSWRLLLLAAALYVAARVAALLYIVVVPCAAALLLTALLQPLTARLRRRGMRPLTATWCTLLLAIVLLGGTVWLVTTRVQADYPSLVTQFKHTAAQVQAWLAGRSTCIPATCSSSPTTWRSTLASTSRPSRAPW